mmetsp:Transcript_27089/g.64496  ORF Transcript_27089/g.64496 Transcript_27089/m.64496 type:complete len:245 (+) Transcript_27089:200-934(+)
MVVHSYICRSVVHLEGHHDLAGVRQDEAVEEGHGAGHLLRGEESHDADHGEAAVVDLHQQTLLLLLGRHVLGEAGGVVERGDLVQRDVLEVGEVARAAALHVMLAAELTPPLEEADKGDDLALALKGHGVPLLGRRHRRVLEAGRQREGPVHAVGLHDETDEGRHRHAAVLDLGVPQEGVGLLVAHAPEVGGAEAHRVKVANGRVEGRRELLLGLHDRHSARGRHGGRHGGRKGQGRRQSGQHN